MNFPKTHVSFILVLFFISLMGCAGTATKESTGEYIDDTWITAKIKAELIGDSIVKSNEVSVETFKGIVQLSGFVDSELAMDQAVLLAREVRGVKSVKNDMRVK